MSGINSTLCVRSWSSGTSTFTSLSGDFAAYYSKTTMKSRLTPHCKLCCEYNKATEQVNNTISYNFLGFTIFDEYANVQGIDQVYIITKFLYLYCSMQLGYSRTPLPFHLLAMSSIELQYFISASSRQPLILLKV